MTHQRWSSVPNGQPSTIAHQWIVVDTLKRLQCTHPCPRTNTPTKKENTTLAKSLGIIRWLVGWWLLLTSAPIMSACWFFGRFDSTVGMNTNGTNSATSASGLFPGTMWPAMSVASCTASSFVDGLSFQLPEMNGVRAIASEEEARGAIGASIHA